MGKQKRIVKGEDGDTKEVFQCEFSRGELSIITNALLWQASTPAFKKMAATYKMRNKKLLFDIDKILFE
jgi:hypothetical protein